MKICAQSGSGGGLKTVWLARGIDARELPLAGMDWNRKPLAQIEQLLRAATPAVLYRGNVARSVAFTVEREHANLHEANRWMLAHDAELTALEANGVISVIFTTQGPGPSGSVTLQTCIIEAKIQPFGIGSTTVYTITGGNLQ